MDTNTKSFNCEKVLAHIDAVHKQVVDLTASINSIDGSRPISQHILRALYDLDCLIDAINVAKERFDVAVQPLRSNTTAFSKKSVGYPLVIVHWKKSGGVRNPKWKQEAISLQGKLHEIKNLPWGPAEEKAYTESVMNATEPSVIRFTTQLSEPA